MKETALCSFLRRSTPKIDGCLEKENGMRPQQQNRRMRGRGNNRKGPNPLTRSYESNGPDVKIRGTAQQIADKYATLARDAQSSGDRVMAENYLQHAEHYNRLIAAAMAQVQPQQNLRDFREDDLGDDEEREEREEHEAQGLPNGNGRAGASSINDGSGPQPVIDGVPAEVALNREMNGSNGRGRANGRGHGGNGANRGAREGAANGEAEKVSAVPAAETPAPAEVPASEAVVAAAPESGAEEAPKPRRTRRPRAKKTDEAAQAEATSPEEAAAQS
uniref:DUF4167 domain-containing protein n=2 Tax=Phyllobacteriaceae TaxID=69277 RepID=Q11E06_CHESB